MIIYGRTATTGWRSAGAEPRTIRLLGPAGVRPEPAVFPMLRRTLASCSRARARRAVDSLGGRWASPGTGRRGRADDPTGSLGGRYVARRRDEHSPPYLADLIWVGLGMSRCRGRKRSRRWERSRALDEMKRLGCVLGRRGRGAHGPPPPPWRARSRAVPGLSRRAGPAWAPGVGPASVLGVGRRGLHGVGGAWAPGAGPASCWAWVRGMARRRCRAWCWGRCWAGSPGVAEPPVWWRWAPVVAPGGRLTTASAARQVVRWAAGVELPRDGPRPAPGGRKAAGVGLAKVVRVRLGERGQRPDDGRRLVVNVGQRGDGRPGTAVAGAAPWRPHGGTLSPLPAVRPRLRRDTPDAD